MPHRLVEKSPKHFYDGSPKIDFKWMNASSAIQTRERERETGGVYINIDPNSFVPASLMGRRQLRVFFLFLVLFISI